MQSYLPDGTKPGAHVPGKELEWGNGEGESGLCFFVLEYYYFFFHTTNKQTNKQTTRTTQWIVYLGRGVLLTTLSPAC